MGRWIVHRNGSKVRVYLATVEEVPERVKEHGSSLVAVCKTMGEAIAARHDAQGRCGGCAHGRGRYRCDACQERELTRQLAASVGMNVVRPRAANDAEIEMSCGHRAALAQRFGR